MPTSKQADKSYIAVMGKIFHVLERFADDTANHGLAFSQIAKDLPFSRTTIHRILYTLAKLGYVEKTEVSSHYRLTRKFHDISGTILSFQHLQAVSKPVMRTLLIRYSETVNLGSLDGGEVTYLDVAQSASALPLAAFPGDRNPVHSTALGKAMLAFLPESQIRTILGQSPLFRRTSHTITQHARFLEHLAMVRGERVALDQEENVDGVTCVAAPIFGPTGKVMAAFSVSGPANRMTAKLSALKSDVRAAATSVTRILKPPPDGNPTVYRSNISSTTTH
jgi:IclR family transcriptional regulator, KDG regulon repressor